MSRRIHRADIALTSNGDMLLNVVALDAPLTLDGLIREARRQRGAVFVGVVLGPREVRRLIDEMGPVLPNVATRIAGPRIWRKRHRAKLGTQAPVTAKRPSVRGKRSRSSARTRNSTDSRGPRSPR